jgi:hypothetical protein
MPAFHAAKELAHPESNEITESFIVHSSQPHALRAPFLAYHAAAFLKTNQQLV